MQKVGGVDALLFEIDLPKLQSKPSQIHSVDVLAANKQLPIASKKDRFRKSVGTYLALQ